MWQFSIFIGNCRKHKTTDIWRCANEDQCVSDKGCSCRTTTRSVRLARQGCWCCACRSSSPVLHESCCRIPSCSPISQRFFPLAVSSSKTANKLMGYNNPCRLYSNVSQILQLYKTWRYYNKFDSTVSLGVHYRCVKIPQCGYMEHVLKDIAFYVQ